MVWLETLLKDIQLAFRSVRTWFTVVNAPFQLLSRNDIDHQYCASTAAKIKRLCKNDGK